MSANVDVFVDRMASSFVCICLRVSILWSSSHSFLLKRREILRREAWYSPLEGERPCRPPTLGVQGPLGQVTMNSYHPSSSCCAQRPGAKHGRGDQGWGTAGWKLRRHTQARESTIWARASLVAQWLRICLPMQGTRVWALVWEDPTCRGAARPVRHNYWACASGARALQHERPR